MMIAFKRHTAVLAGMAAVTLGTGAAGCSLWQGTDAETEGAGAEAVTLAVSPGRVASNGQGNGAGTGAQAGADRPRPDSPIAVQARQGTIQDVTVTTKGEEVEGALGAGGAQWRSRWSLEPGTAYAVTATALGKDGRTRTVRSRFTTAKARKTLGITYEAPFDKEVVGVGMPIVMRFGRRVTDRAAVERAMEVRSSKPVEGAWHWFEDGRSLVFRTKEHWPRHTDVSLRAHLSGVAGAKGVYGGQNETVKFRVGDKHITKAGEDSHKMVVKKNGKTVRKIPISVGKGGVSKYTTTNGHHLTMEKGNPVTMSSDWEGCGPGCAGYYSLTVRHAIRISNSGEYVHSAPWSVGSQGSSNVSHGCVNASPSHARWFYNFSYRGDPFEVTGSSRELEPDNGWGYWQLDWDDWVKGSALKQSIKIGPNGGVPSPHASREAASGGGAGAGPGAGTGRP